MSCGGVRGRGVRLRLLARLKGLLCHLPLGLGIIEFCHECGIRQPVVWTARDELWREVVGGPYGVLCPGCFDKAAVAKGLFLRWKPIVEGDRRVPTKSG